MKAIIPAAGLGTRFLPGTKCTPKEMLPVLDKPVIQYVVEEALDPEEVDGVIIVTSPGKPELLSYFQPDRSLENLLRERGKPSMPMPLPTLATCRSTSAISMSPRAWAMPFALPPTLVAGENFLVLLGRLSWCPIATSATRCSRSLPSTVVLPLLLSLHAPLMRFRAMA